MATSVCLTKKQANFFKFISDFKTKNGFYPEISLAARELKLAPAGVVNYYGSLFLRGVFSDGKPQTRFHADAHSRSESKANKPAQKKPVVKKIDKQAQVAALLVKLLSGEKVDSKYTQDILASLSG